ncbi:HXXEE domain-containing protein [Fredinandcohnia sp. 179-A 10B2 NHS]|uniref:HXXEE domain-containing protein n=1 Tax=Fredinandcohnia sp. 179-A 10B2 NHS TaxID=3235176 RepID=UPI0039A37703
MNPKLQRFLILFPFLYLLHDIEEIMTVEKFLITNSTSIPFRVTGAEFAFAFTLLLIFASIGCFKAFSGRKFLRMEPTTYLSFLVPGILLANGIGHVLQFIFFKDYVPGIITTILIIFPYSFLTVKFLITERILTVKKFLSFLLIGFVLQAPLALIAHFISKLTFSFLF